jgi:hypothetical protein
MSTHAHAAQLQSHCAGACVLTVGNLFIYLLLLHCSVAVAGFLCSHHPLIQLTPKRIPCSAIYHRLCIVLLLTKSCSRAVAWF